MPGRAGARLFGGPLLPEIVEPEILAPDRRDSLDDTANSDLAPDACRSSCERPWCGDGVIDTGESCDEGAANSDLLPDRCRTDCRGPRCGDGVRDAGEGCDWGAANSDELSGACRTRCVVASCGDGVVDAGEECDRGEANSDAAPDTCRTDCRLPRCGDAVTDPERGENCDDGDDDPTDGCHRCAWYVGGCPLNGRYIIDASGGLPWGGEELVLSGTLVGATNYGPNFSCNGGFAGDVLYAFPIPRRGDLVVRVTSVDGGFVPSIEIRSACDSGSLACENAPEPGAPAVAVVPVDPVDRIRFVQIEHVTGTPGPFELSLRIFPPLAAGSPCAIDRTSGSCAEGLTCHDPDGDGHGACAWLVPPGGACDPAGVESVCVESACACPTPGCAVGTCASTCGDGSVQPWEECDDGIHGVVDNCDDACRQAGRSCAEPFLLHRALRPDGVYEWQGDASRGISAFHPSCGRGDDSREVHAAFLPPEGGTWAFRVTGVDYAPVLSIVRDACDSGLELACDDSGPRVATVRVELSAGVTVWAVVEGGASDRAAAVFTLLAERIVCGDGVTGLSEECDDGNVESGDGCSAACAREPAP